MAGLILHIGHGEKSIFNGHNVKATIAVTAGWTGVIMLLTLLLLFTIIMRSTAIHLTG